MYFTHRAHGSNGNERPVTRAINLAVKRATPERRAQMIATGDTHTNIMQAMGEDNNKAMSSTYVKAVLVRFRVRSALLELALQLHPDLDHLERVGDEARPHRRHPSQEGRRGLGRGHGHGDGTELGPQ